MPSRRLYIDWSGDAGFRTSRGASSVVVIAVVQVENYESLEQRIAKLRSNLRVPATFEFHWAKIGWTERDAYIETICSEDFQSWAMIVDKTEIRQEGAYLTANQAMCAWIAELFINLPEGMVSGAELVVDDGTKAQAMAKAIREAVSSALRKRRIEQRLKGARSFPAHRNEALQLADMIAGATRVWRVEGNRDYGCHFGAKLVVSKLGK